MVYSDGGTWYPEECNVLVVKHYLHSFLAKSLMSRVNPYFKNRIILITTILYQDACNLLHVHNC